MIRHSHLNDFIAPVPPGRSRSPKRIKSLIVALGSLNRLRCVRLKPTMLFSAAFPPLEVCGFEDALVPSMYIELKSVQSSLSESNRSRRSVPGSEEGVSHPVPTKY